MSGGDEYARYARDLALAADGIDEKAAAATDEVGRGALSTARGRAPVDTGRLRSELRLVRRGSAVAVESATPYSIYQEFGTSRMPAHPFIGPAFDRWAPELVRKVEAVRDDVVRKL